MQEALRFGSQHATNNFDGDVEATQRMAAQAEQVAMLLARAEQKGELHAPTDATKEAVMAGAISPVAVQGKRFFDGKDSGAAGGQGEEKGGGGSGSGNPVVFDDELFRDLEATGILPVVQVGSDGEMLSRPTINEIRRALGHFKVMQPDGTLADPRDVQGA